MDDAESNAARRTPRRKEQNVGVLFSISLEGCLAMLLSLPRHQCDVRYSRRTETPLQITVTDGGYAVRPEIAAGQYQVTIENLSGQRVDLMLVRIPDGMSTAEIQAVLVSDTAKLVSGLIQPSTLESAQSPDMIAFRAGSPT